MKEIFIKYRVAIFRTLGAFMLIIGFIAYFWLTPKEVISENEIAAANVARMEASIASSSKSTTSAKAKPDSSKFLEELKNAQKKQTEYLIILSMICGGLFLAYSFIDKLKK